MKIAAAIPWNLPGYAAASGSHPLYRALLEDNAVLEFHAIDEIALARKLHAGAQRPGDAAAGRLRAPALPAFLRDTEPGRQFIRHLTPDGIALCDALPGQIELHHTGPFTTGGRPFVLHCESFWPIFSPFTRPGSGGVKNGGRMRELYRRLLGQASCLGIYSHLPRTLAEISRFFRDAGIDAKLHPSRIGLSQSEMGPLLTGRRAETGARPVFLFVGSACQDAGDFARRGGHAALQFAERFLRAGNAGRFLFLASRPRDEEFSAAGVDAGYLKSAEAQQIFWLDGHFPQHELLRLYRISDFLLLPSPELHSVTLMRALAAGTVPLITDTCGPETFVTDGETGVVLKGVRDAVWHEDPDSGVLVDSHPAPSYLAARLAGQLFDRVTALLADPAALRSLRDRGRRYAERHFSGPAFRDEFSESVARLWHAGAAGGARLQPAPDRHGLAEHETLGAEGWSRFFEGPPQATLVLDVGNARIHSTRGFYVLEERGAPVASPAQVAARLGEFRPELFFQFDPASRLVARLRHRLVRWREAAKKRLARHKRLYRVARSAGRQLLAAYWKLGRRLPG
jgi:glycosyltransferase involved in cell wall biosynthesis